MLANVDGLGGMLNVDLDLQWKLHQNVGRLTRPVQHNHTSWLSGSTSSNSQSEDANTSPFTLGRNESVTFLQGGPDLSSYNMSESTSTSSKRKADDTSLWTRTSFHALDTTSLNTSYSGAFQFRTTFVSTEEDDLGHNNSFKRMRARHSPVSGSEEVRSKLTTTGQNMWGEHVPKFSESDHKILQTLSHGRSEQSLWSAPENGANVNAQSGHFLSPLQAASFWGHVGTVRRLLEDGADVNAQGGSHYSALHAASCNGNEQIVQLLLKSGADVNMKCTRSGSALYTASCNGYGGVVRLLLENGADVNAQGGYFRNPLQAASFWGHAEIVQLLLSSGADANAQGRYSSALEAARSNGRKQIVQLLCRHGA